MCGFAGCWQSEPAPRDVLAARARAMSGTLVHRGPDDDGVWIDERAGLALGFRRLAILDLSPQGHQPMVSSDERYVVVFNGEIYNFTDLRDELEQAGAAPSWRGHSDTEVILAAFVHWGIEDALTRMTGMFALALWDSREKILHLARDRMGEKPLYYGWSGNVLLFGSELKALAAHPAFRPDVDRESVAALLRYAYVPSPRSIFRGVFKLPPGCLVSIRAGQSFAEPRRYWSLAEVIQRGLEQPFDGTEREATDALDRLLRRAVAGQMIADVPLGAFLSGGIDSSLVVALMQAQSTQPVKTFTIGFHEEAYNEAPHADAVARHLGTEHTELYVTAAEAMGAIPGIPALYDEPFADSSQVPTYLVAKLARSRVTVSLSGDGGDELFGGYNRYFWGESIWRHIENKPRALRRAAAGAITALAPAAWDRLFATVDALIPARFRQPAAGDKLHKLARAIDVADGRELYERFVAHWSPHDLMPHTSSAHKMPELPAQLSALPDQMMAWDAMTYLPDDILVKVDRAAMSVSLESRAPLLDHRVVEFAWRLPLAMKIRNGKGKWLVRQLLYRYVPQRLVERQKMGFGLPLDAWLRGGLREWAETLLDEARLKREGYFEPGPVRSKWNEHLAGHRNWQHLLWVVLMFEAWLEKWTATPTPAKAP